MMMWHGTMVAVKFPTRGPAGTLKDSQRTQQKELDAMSKLKHPRIVPVLGVTTKKDGTPGFLMP